MQRPGGLDGGLFFAGPTQCQCFLSRRHVARGGRERWLRGMSKVYCRLRGSCCHERRPAACTGANKTIMPGRDYVIRIQQPSVSSAGRTDQNLNIPDRQMVHSRHGREGKETLVIFVEGKREGGRPVEASPRRRSPPTTEPSDDGDGRDVEISAGPLSMARGTIGHHGHRSIMRRRWRGGLLSGGGREGRYYSNHERGRRSPPQEAGHLGLRRVRAKRERRIA
jgi:hypothetical protein